MKHHLLPALLATTAAIQAQVCITGVVEPVNGPTICMQGETHRLADTSVYLRSTQVPLHLFVGQNVRIEGADIGVTCRVLDVTAIGPARARLSHCGTPMPGCPLRFKVEPGAIGRYALLASFTRGYQPMGCAPPSFLDGTVLLGSPSYTLVIAMFPGPSGDYVWQIPNVPSLWGIQIWFQGVRQGIGPIGPVELTNVEHITLVPFMPPCGGINC